MGQEMLTSGLVRQLIMSQFPTAAVSAVDLLGEGWDFWAFGINHQWIFRYPKSAESDRRLLVELRLLEYAAPLLPLRVPRYEFRGVPSERFPYHFAGYARLPGEPAMHAGLAPVTVAVMATQLGEFVGRVHGLHVDHAIALGLESCLRDDSLAATREGALQDFTSVSGLMDPDLRGRCLGFLEDESCMPPEYEGPERVLHNDLGHEHVLVEPGAGKVTGVIDWTDAAVGDPALDFAPLYAWQGEPFFQAMMKPYRPSVDPGFGDRVRYRAICMAVGSVYFGVQSGQSAYRTSGLGSLRRLLGPGGVVTP